MTLTTRSELLPKLLLPAVFCFLGLLLTGRAASAAALSATLTYAQTSATTATLTAVLTSPGMAGDMYTYAFSKTAGPGAVAGLPFTTAATTATSAAQTITVSTPSMNASDYSFQVVVHDTTHPPPAFTDATAAMSATVQKTAAITVTPASTTVDIAANDQFTAVAKDQFGTPLTFATVFTWSKTAGTGTIAPTGMNSIEDFTAPSTIPGATSETDTVTATNTGITGMASITVDDVAPTVATSAAATPNPVTGTTAMLSVLGAYPGGEANLTYTWSTTSAPAGAPAIVYSGAANGTNAAKTITATFGKAGPYTLKVTITDPSSATVTSSVTFTVNQTATSVSIAPATATVPVATTKTFTATVSDQFGAVLTTQPPVDWTAIRGAVTTPTATTTYTPPDTSGPDEITAAVLGTSVSTTIRVTVAAGAAAQFLVQISPVTSASGTARTVTVTAEDQFSNIATGYVGTIHFTTSDPAAGVVLPTDYTFTPADNGKHTFSGGLTLITSGNQVVTATDTISSATGSGFAEVTAGPMADIAVSAPTTVSLDAPFTVTATAVDAHGNTVLSNNDLILVTTSDTSPNTLVPTGVKFTNGTATFSVTLGTVGSQTITVKDTVNSIVSAPVTVMVNNTGVTVATAAAATPSPVTGTTTALSVLGAYIGGESSLTYTWVASGPAPVTFTFATGVANGTNGAKNTTATFTQAGSYVFTVTIAGPSTVNSTTSSVGVLVDQTLTAITVTPLTATVNVGGTQQFTASATDQFGNPDSTLFSWSRTAGTGTVNAIGLFTAPNTIPGATTETDTVVASSGSATPGTATVTVNDVAPTIATPAAANAVTGSLTTAAKSVTLTVLGAYDGGESNLTYTWTVSPSAGVSLPASGTNASKNLTATFTQAGTYTFTVTISDPSGNSATSQVIVVVSQTLTAIAVSPSTATVPVAGMKQFTAAATDQFGKPDAVAFSWSVISGTGTVTTTGLFTAPSTLVGLSESDIVQAASGSIMGTATVTVTDTTPTVATPAAANGMPVSFTTPAGATTVALTILGGYPGGEGNLTYTWTYTGPTGASFAFASNVVNGTNAAKATTAAFTQAGTYTFTATIADPSGKMVTSSVMVIVGQTLTKITVTPATATVAVAGMQQFTAAATDQFGNPDAATFTWSVVAGTGTVTTTGLFTAPSTLTGTSETDTVQAASGTVVSTPPATVTVNDATPTVATPAEANGVPVSNTTGATTVALTVLGGYPGGESHLIYTWSETGPAPVTFAFATGVVNGTNGAKTTTATFTQAGVYVFTVTIADPSKNKITSTVTVDVSQTLTKITVTPAKAPPTFIAGTQQFTATATDQFNKAFTTPPTFTWTVAKPGTGKVDTTGLFTAPSLLTGASETDTVQAADGTVVGTASITVSDSGPTVATPAEANGVPVSNTTGATTLALTVLGGYPGGEGSLNYTWSETGPAPVTFAFAPNVRNGMNGAKATTATFTQAGVYTFTATIADLSGKTTMSSVIVTVTQTPTSVAVSSPSTPIIAATNYSFMATVSDQFGAVMTTQPQIDWTATRGVPTTPGATTTYTAPDKAGQDQVTATVHATTIAMTVSVTVLAGKATQLVVAVNPSTTQSETPFTMTVTAEDQFFNIVTGYTGKVSFSTSDPGNPMHPVQLPQPYQFTPADNGQHPFSDVVLVSPGNQTITATDGSISGSGTVQITNGDLASLTITTTLPLVNATYVATATSTFMVTVTALDSGGNVITTLDGAASSASIALSGAGDPTFTAPAFALSSGTATIPITLNTLTGTGSDTLTATVTQTNGAITKTAALTPIAVIDGFTSLSPADATVGDPTFTTFKIIGNNFAAKPGTNTFIDPVAFSYLGQFADPSDPLVYSPLTTTVDSSTLLNAVVDPPSVAGSTVTTTTIPLAGQYLAAIPKSGTTQIFTVDPLPGPKTDPARTISGTSFGSFASGLQMISVPYDYDYGSANTPKPDYLAGTGLITDVFKLLDFSQPNGPLVPPTYQKVGPDLRFAVWDPTADKNAGSYLVTGNTTGSVDPNHLLIGQGYWVRFPQTGAITGTSDAEPGLVTRGIPATAAEEKILPDGAGRERGYDPTTGQFAIPLNTGWNIVGNPFPNAVQLTFFQAAAANTNGALTKVSLNDANSLGILSNTLYSYDSSIAQYVPLFPGATGVPEATIPAGQTSPPAIGVLYPYSGYWILAFQPCTLFVSSN